MKYCLLSLIVITVSLAQESPFVGGLYEFDRAQFKENYAPSLIYFMPYSFMDRYSETPSIFDKRSQVVERYAAQCDSACTYPKKVVITDSVFSTIAALGSRYFDTSYTYWGLQKTTDSTFEWTVLDSLELSLSFSIEEAHCAEYFLIDLEIVSDTTEILFYLGIPPGHYRFTPNGWTTKVRHDSTTVTDSAGNRERHRDYDLSTFTPNNAEHAITRLLLIEKNPTPYQAAHSELLAVLKNGDTTQLFNAYPLCNGKDDCSAKVEIIAITDVNADQNIDILFRKYSGEVVLLIQNDDGTFQHFVLTQRVSGESC